MVGKYVYWSDRAIRRTAEDNGIELAGRARWSAGLNSGLLQASRAGRERLTRNRVEEARRLERGLGTAVVDDLTAPLKAPFINVTGKVTFARFPHWYAKNPGALLHLQTRSGAGRRVDLCLFGSMDNVRGFGPWDDFEDGWTSSEMPAVEELLRAQGLENALWDEDAEYLSLEVLKIALCQGSTGTHEEHADHPQTRGFTVGHNDACAVFAEVYSDVVLDPRRWSHHAGDPLAGADRIIVGRPLWVRTLHPEATVRYPELRNGTRRAARWWLRRLHLLPYRSTTASARVTTLPRDAQTADDIPPRPYRRPS
ncbi:hypothetical protein ACFYN0_01035 [Streptomyces sp. NPDC006704]|uniref:hypothetical protein n=1 Tax=Streptomyces sp. NPDC006704 TaxID=3364760 RepID=UPI0036C7E155